MCNYCGERNNLARLQILLEDELSDCEPNIPFVLEVLNLIEDGAIAFMLDDVLEIVSPYYTHINNNNKYNEW